MRKIAVVWSSPNADRLTASAKDQFVKGLSDAGARIEEIHLNKKAGALQGLRQQLENL